MMKKSEETKQKILETTIEAIAEKGYAPTTTKEIAERAGVSEGTIFKYYGSKKELLREIVESTIKELRDYSVNEAIPEIFAETSDRSPKELIYRLMKERTKFFREHESAMQVILQETMIDESIRETFRQEVWGEITKITDQIFDRAKELGKFKDFENRVLRRAIFGSFFFWVIYEEMLEVNGHSEEGGTKEVEKTLDLLMTGILEEQETE
jgi:AcrR family transcriptional regulator